MILELACDKCGSHRFVGPTRVYDGIGPDDVTDSGDWACANCGSRRLSFTPSDKPFDSEPEQAPTLKVVL